MKALERALEPSRRAASGEGPNTAMPAGRTASRRGCRREETVLLVKPETKDNVTTSPLHSTHLVERLPQHHPPKVVPDQERANPPRSPLPTLPTPQTLFPIPHPHYTLSRPYPPSHHYPERRKSCSLVGIGRVCKRERVLDLRRRGGGWRGRFGAR
jgi:hypothetical protein